MSTDIESREVLPVPGPTPMSLSVSSLRGGSTSQRYRVDGSPCSSPVPGAALAHLPDEAPHTGAEPIFSSHTSMPHPYTLAALDWDNRTHDCPLIIRALTVRGRQGSLQPDTAAAGAARADSLRLPPQLQPQRAPLSPGTARGASPVSPSYTPLAPTPPPEAIVRGRGYARCRAASMGSAAATKSTEHAYVASFKPGSANGTQTQSQALQERQQEDLSGRLGKLRQASVGGASSRGLRGWSSQVVRSHSAHSEPPSRSGSPVDSRAGGEPGPVAAEAADAAAPAADARATTGATAATSAAIGQGACGDAGGAIAAAGPGGPRPVMPPLFAGASAALTCSSSSHSTSRPLLPAATCPLPASYPVVPTASPRAPSPTAQPLPGIPCRGASPDAGPPSPPLGASATASAIAWPPLRPASASRARRLVDNLIHLHAGNTRNPPLESRIVALLGELLPPPSATAASLAAVPSPMAPPPPPPGQAAALKEAAAQRLGRALAQRREVVVAAAAVQRSLDAGGELAAGPGPGAGPGSAPGGARRGNSRAGQSTSGAGRGGPSISGAAPGVSISGAAEARGLRGEGSQLQPLLPGAIGTADGPGREAGGGLRAGPSQAELELGAGLAAERSLLPAVASLDQYGLAQRAVSGNLSSAGSGLLPELERSAAPVSAPVAFMAPNIVPVPAISFPAARAPTAPCGVVRPAGAEALHLRGLSYRAAKEACRALAGSVRRGISLRELTAVVAGAQAL